MSSPSLSSIFQVGTDVLRTVLSKTGLLLAQTGSVTSEQTETDEVEWWQHVGFLSRPPKATAKQSACQAVTIRRGDRDVCIATRDLRGVELAGNIKEGETVIYAAGDDGKAQGRVICKADGSINVFTTDTNDATGSSVYFRVAKDGFSWVAPWGTIRFDATGFHVRHTSGARLDLGGVGGLPFPLNELSSYATLSAGMVSASGALNALSSAPDASPAAKSAPLIEFMGLVATAISLCAAATTGPGAPAAVSGAAAVAGAVPGLAGSVSSGTLV